jgi:hypothetical protein
MKKLNIQQSFPQTSHFYFKVQLRKWDQTAKANFQETCQYPKFQSCFH